MAIALAQKKNGGAGTGSTTATVIWTSNTTTGNLITVGVSTSFGTVSSVTDSQSNTYTQIGTTISQTNAILSMYYAKNITGGTTPTITVTNGSSAEINVVAFEYSGLDTTAPLDKTTGTSGINTTASSGATAATTTASEVVVGFVGVGGAAPTVGTGYGNLLTNTASAFSVGMEDKIVSATGAQTATFTTPFTFWACGVATFKAGSSAVNATVTQVAATITATGGTQAIATVRSLNITQSAGSITATGGTQTIATVNTVAITQLAGTITATSGTQVITTVRNATVTQAAGVVTASGGTQVVSAVVVASASVTQVAGAITATGGTQTIKIGASVTQAAANITATGGAQTIATVNMVTITQLAGTITATGGTQVITTLRNTTVTQIAGNVIATGGTQSIVGTSSTTVTQVAATLIVTGKPQIIVATVLIPPVFVSINAIIGTTSSATAVGDELAFANVGSTSTIEAVNGSSETATVDSPDTSAVINTNNTNRTF